MCAPEAASFERDDVRLPVLHLIRGGDRKHAAHRCYEHGALRHARVARDVRPGASDPGVLDRYFIIRGEDAVREALEQRTACVS